MLISYVAKWQKKSIIASLNCDFFHSQVQQSKHKQWINGVKKNLWIHLSVTVAYKARG